MKTANAFLDEAQRAWDQKRPGTAATPPADFVNAFAIQKMSEHLAGVIDELERRFVALEDRVTTLERGE